MSRLLIIEDSPAEQALYRGVFRAEHEVAFDPGGAGTLRAALAFRPDIIILDLHLADGDGLSLLGGMRRAPPLARVPVLFVSGAREPAKRLAGLRLGAQDFIAKPFDAEELRLKVRNHLELARPAAPAAPVIPEIEGLQLDLLVGRARATSLPGPARELELAPLEFKLLVHLARSFGEVATRRGLLEAVWGTSVHVGARTVDAHVSALRRRLAPAGFKIASVYGRGYRLERAALSTGCAPARESTSEGAPSGRSRS